MCTSTLWAPVLSESPHAAGPVLRPLLARCLSASLHDRTHEAAVGRERLSSEVRENRMRILSSLRSVCRSVFFF